MTAPTNESLKTVFQNLDVHKEGHITKRELVKLIMSFDINGDGTVSHLEFEKCFTKRLGGSTESARKLFNQLDDDASGDISVIEIHSLFDRLDEAKTGVISEAMFIKKWKTILAL